MIAPEIYLWVSYVPLVGSNRRSSWRKIIFLGLHPGGKFGELGCIFGSGLAHFSVLI